VDAANDLAFLEAQDDLRKPSKTSTGSQTAILPLRLRASGLGLRFKNRRLPPGRMPDSANSHRFHSAPLQSRQRTAPLARSFIALHSTLESSETGRMNRPCHASCRNHEARQLRPLRGNCQWIRQ